MKLTSKAANEAHTPIAFPMRDGVTLRGDCFGVAENPLVVMLPGGGQARSAWHRTAAMLAGKGYRCLTIDLRGQGDSDWSPQGAYHFDDYAADMSNVIDTLGGPTIMVGSSLGGLVSLATAGATPAKISHVVLADVTPYQSGNGGVAIRAMMATGKDGFASVEDAGQWIARFMGTPPRTNYDALREHLREDKGRWFWRWDPRIIEDRYVYTPEIIKRLEDDARSLHQPILLIHAEHSIVVSPEDVKRFTTLAPHVMLRDLPGAHHMVSGDSNQSYGMLILDFLSNA